MRDDAEASAEREHTKGNLFLILFGLGFTVLPFLILSLMVIPTLTDGWQMRTWQPRQAELLATDLEVGRTGGVSYRVTARYRYHWHDGEHMASRVGINIGSDNIGDWQERTYQRLLSSRQITVWVNPDQPDEAVIDREPRWGLLAFQMIFILLFGGIGLALFISGVRRRSTYNAQPVVTSWANLGMDDQYIHPEGKSELMVMWLFAVIMLIFSGMIFINVEGITQKGIGAHWLILLFPFAALWLVIQASIKSLRWRRFRGTLLRLEPFPGETGGQVSGTIDLPQGAEQALVRVRLSCIHGYWQRSGNKRQRTENILWQDLQLLPVTPGIRGGRIAFTFQPAADLPASSMGDNYHKWVLTLEADVEGPDMALRFELPVVRAVTPLSGSASTSHETASAALLPEWLQIGYQGGALEVELPILRNKAFGISITIFGGIFTGTGIVLMKYTHAPLIFSLLFALIGLLFVMGGLYSLGNSLRSRFSPQGVELLRRVYGIPFIRNIDATQLNHIRSRIGVQTGNRAFYQVELLLQNGRRVTVADSLPGAGAADYLIAQLRRHLKRELTPPPAPDAQQLQADREARVHIYNRLAHILVLILFLIFVTRAVLDFMR